MRTTLNKYDLGLFLKTGIVVLTFMAVVFSGMKYLPQAVTVTNHTNSTKIPIQSVETDKKVVSLTFDINSTSEDLDSILNILEKHNVKASFFVTGKWLDENYQDITNIIDGGHDIGNHSDNHRHMDLLSKKECEEEIMNLHNKVKDITGIEMTLYRPPYGDFNNTLIHTAEEQGYSVIKWDIDSLDWKDYSVNNIIKQTSQNINLRNGSIILFHSDTKYTAKALEEVVFNLLEKGYQIAPVSELIYKEDYTIDMAGRQYQN